MSCEASNVKSRWNSITVLHWHLVRHGSGGQGLVAPFQSRPCPQWNTDLKASAYRCKKERSVASKIRENVFLLGSWPTRHRWHTPRFCRLCRRSPRVVGGGRGASTPKYTCVEPCLELVAQHVAMTTNCFPTVRHRMFVNILWKSCSCTEWSRMWYEL